MGPVPAPTPPTPEDLDQIVRVLAEAAPTFAPRPVDDRAVAALPEMGLLSRCGAAADWMDPHRLLAAVEAADAGDGPSLLAAVTPDALATSFAVDCSHFLAAPSPPRGGLGPWDTASSGGSRGSGGSGSTSSGGSSTRDCTSVTELGSPAAPAAAAADADADPPALGPCTLVLSTLYIPLAVAGTVVLGVAVHETPHNLLTPLTGGGWDIARVSRFAYDGATGEFLLAGAPPPPPGADPTVSYDRFAVAAPAGAPPSLSWTAARYQRAAPPVPLPGTAVGLPGGSGGGGCRPALRLTSRTVALMHRTAAWADEAATPPPGGLLAALAAGVSGLGTFGVAAVEDAGDGARGGSSRLLPPTVYASGPSGVGMGARLCAAAVGAVGVHPGALRLAGVVAGGGPARPPPPRLSRVSVAGVAAAPDPAAAAAAAGAPAPRRRRRKVDASTLTDEKELRRVLRNRRSAAAANARKRERAATVKAQAAAAAAAGGVEGGGGEPMDTDAAAAVVPELVAADAGGDDDELSGMIESLLTGEGGGEDLAAAAAGLGLHV